MLERIKLLHTCKFTILTLSLHLSDKVFKVTCPTLQTWRTCPEKGPLNQLHPYLAETGAMQCLGEELKTLRYYSTSKVPAFTFSSPTGLPCLKS